MAVDLLLERRGNMLLPYDAKAMEDMQSLPIGRGIACKVWLPRSIDQNGWYWVELANVVQATDCAPTSKHLHQGIKINTGWTMPIFNARKDVICHIPDSTNFQSMDQPTFNRFMLCAQRFLAEEFGYVMEVKHGPRNP